MSTLKKLPIQIKAGDKFSTYPWTREYVAEKDAQTALNGHVLVDALWMNEHKTLSFRGDEVCE